MSSPLLDCTPVIGAAVLGLAVVVWRRKLGDCWAALTRVGDEAERTDPSRVARGLVADALRSGRVRHGHLILDHRDGGFYLNDGVAVHRYGSAAAADEAITKRLLAERGGR